RGGAGGLGPERRAAAAAEDGCCWGGGHSADARGWADRDHLSTVEKDTNGEVLWVWCYPSTTATLRNLLLRKCCLTDENKLLHPFVFGQYRRTWFYITTIEVPDSSVLKKVTHFSIVLTAKDFNPEKYAAFARILCRMYLKHGSPVKMMESYIAVLTKGICQSEENGSFLSKDFDARKAYLAGSIKGKQTKRERKAQAMNRIPEARPASL
uniref:UDENN domain-containing protein n=1 Tax=Urocitellus parryii TaxID=9999 RepID=A0A8D2H9R2_UROPR